MDFLVHLIQHGFVFCYSLIPSWGFAIILLTTLIKLTLLPLQVIGAHQQAKLKRIRPELEALQVKYKDDLRKLFEERAALMKASGVKSWVMLLATVIQLPIFLSIYNSLSGNQTISGAGFGWMTSLGAVDSFFILPTLVALLMWLQMKSSNGPSKGMSYALTAVSFAVTATLPAAIGLYSVTSTAFQLVSQRVIERMI